ncbi:MAG: nitroreductase [Alphaproteobacteria bacterium]
MELMEGIRTRRSVRAYTGEKLDRAKLDALLDAAILAPSSMNSQPWAFAVVQDAARLSRYSENAKAVLLELAASDPRIAHYRDRLSDPEFDIFYGAGTLIAICADRAWANAVADCYLAGQTLLLAAHAMGLGACCIGFARPYLNEPEVKAELSIPSGYEVALPMIVGVPAGAPAAVSRRPPKILSWLN